MVEMNPSGVTKAMAGSDDDRLIVRLVSAFPAASRGTTCASADCPAITEP